MTEDKTGNSDAKAELDKDGLEISNLDEVESEMQQNQSEENFSEDDFSKESSNQEPAIKIHLLRKHRFVITVGIIGLFCIVAFGGALLFLKSSREPPQMNPPQILAEQIQTCPDCINLEPFIILFEPIDEQKAGMLIAQFSLQIYPDLRYAIEGSLFEVRSRILETLSKNVEIYSKEELSDMMRENLSKWAVKKVRIVQYDLL
ncbi:MAG: hypothetical protein JW920_10615 [Deltaproteobacteria bacterium]|nr:hypothetical protein [Deltaproteobacteria bacterium]